MTRCDCRDCRRTNRVWHVAGLVAATVLFLVCAYAFILMAAAYTLGTAPPTVEFNPTWDENVTHCYHYGKDVYGAVRCTGWEA